MKKGLIPRLKFTAGISLMILNTGIWINGLFINRERGMDIVLAVPLFVAGAFMVLGWYKTSGNQPVNKYQQWRFILSILLVNYLVLYFIYMIADILVSPAIDFLNIPGIILPLALGLFITGFILSWEYEAYAGVFFLLWYFLILFGQIHYFELRNRGPYILIGIVLLLHGILNLYYHFRIKPKE